jgi:phytoene synthase
MQDCQRITRKSASNLALAFIMLPRAKRDGMSALYAFCREVDDIADESSLPVEERRRRLIRWRQEVRHACQGRSCELPVILELKPIIAKYGLAYELFDQLIQGVEMDLDTNRYRDYEALDLYCYRVASVVGLLSIEIFGYNNPKCQEYAVALGKALQYTNILRDVKTDAARDRIYLPLSELERHEVLESEILQGRYSARYRALTHAVSVRARSFYHEAYQLLPAEDRRSMVAAELMGAVYWTLLKKLEQQQFNVFDQDIIKVKRWHKIALILRTWWRVSLGGNQDNYGMV